MPLLIALAPSWGWIVTANVFLGVNQGLAWSMTVVMKIDLVGPERRGLALGLNEAAGYGGVAVAAALSGWLAAEFVARDVLVVAGFAIAAAALLVCVLFVRDTAPHVALEQARDHDEKATAPRLRDAFPGATYRVPALRACSQAGLVNNLNDAPAWGVTPLFLASKGASVGEIGVIAGLYPAIWGLGQIWTGHWSDSIGRKPLIVAGMLVQAAALALLAASGGRLGPAAIAAVGLGLGTALVYPTLIAAISDTVAPVARAATVGGCRHSRERDLCLAMICQRVIAPASKLATARSLGQSTLACELDVEGADEDDLYRALDWLLARQERIEDRLARRHLADGELVLYDVSSSFEGRTCPLAKLGYSRDQRRGTPQIVYGLLCDKPGRPLAVEVFSGELHDHKTLPSQVEKLKARFGLKAVIVVSDRGMVTKANLELIRASEGIEWITALKAPQIKALVASGALQLSLFDESNLAEITAPDYPGERLVVCRNPLVAAERARKREELLAATERGLAEIQARVKRGTLQGAAEIGLAVGPAVSRYRMRKHFELAITDTTFTLTRKGEQIAAEAALDGIYVLRTSADEKAMAMAEVVRSYKGLEQVERAFGTLKGPELEIRPIHHRLEDRVRAHVLLCTLAYYLTWHLRAAWAPLLFKDECPPTAVDPVAKATRSASAQRKAQTKHSADGEPCHSFRTLLAELATQTRNTIRLAGAEATFERLAEPTPLQARALALAEDASVIA